MPPTIRCWTITLAALVTACGVPFGLAADAPAARPKPPLAVLENAHAKVTLALPNAETGLYREFRFDWSGIVALAEADGHAYFGYNRTSDAGEVAYLPRAGTTDEFKVNLTLVEAPETEADPPGEYMRIGVGVVTSYWELKDKRPQRKWRLTEPFAWTVTHSETAIEFHQAVTRGHWGYDLTKTVALLPDDAGFTIQREFRNTGEQAIVCDHYCHNWIRIDGEEVAQQMTLRFPFRPEAIDGWRASDKTTLEQQSESWELGFSRRLWAELGAMKRLQDNAVSVRNANTGGQVDLTGDWIPDAFNLYAQPGEVCPEPFIRLELQPRESRTWTTTYRFKATPIAK